MEICVLLGNQFHKVKSHYLSPVGRGLEDFFGGGGIWFSAATGRDQSRLKEFKVGL